jgi:predicted methyltransferase
MKAFVLFCVVAGFGISAIAQSAGLADRVVSQMNAEDRSADDKGRDDARRPNQVLAFLGVEEGMIALDFFAGGGYYTELLSAAVGESGKVYSHNVQRALEMRDGRNQSLLDTRLSGARLPNVQMWVREVGQLGLDETVDLALTALNLHDIWIRGGEEQAVLALRAIYASLKPGGTLGVIDHVGVNEELDKQMHRLRPNLAKNMLVQAGFEIEAVSGILANPNDDHTLHVFDEKLGRKTDRFLIKAVKPGT